MNPTLIFSDGGAKAAGMGKERANCTVVATAVVLGVPNIQAHRSLELLGRKKGKGFHFEAVATYYNMKCLTHEPPDFGPGVCTVSPKTLRDWLPDLQQGRYVVGVKGHVFAVVDGIIYDGFSKGLGQLVRKLWRHFPPQSTT